MDDGKGALWQDPPKAPKHFIILSVMTYFECRFYLAMGTAVQAGRKPLPILLP